MYKAATRDVSAILNPTEGARWKILLSAATWAALEALYS